MIEISRYMIAGNDVFKAIMADTHPFIVKGGWFPSSIVVPHGKQAVGTIIFSRLKKP